MPYKDPEKQKAAQRRYYEENKQKYIDSVRDRRQKCRLYVIQVKDNAECADCEETFPHYIMDFDHVSGKKVGNISDLAREGSMELLLKEIAKCDLVCSNCHRHRTWMRSKNNVRGSNGLEENK